MSSSIQEEAKAFDLRIEERVKHGHLPDLRRMQDCDWFYNNPWRRRYLAQQVFGEYVDFALEHLRGPRVLEVGAGAGHMSLELARNGYHVTGVDVSERSIRVARHVAREGQHAKGFGSLRYLTADFLELRVDARFDSVCFFCSLHHFDDPERVVHKARRLLVDGGRIIVVEPARDAITKNDATLIYLMRVLLSFGGAWHETLPIPTSASEIEAGVWRVREEYAEAHDVEEEEQSPHDNACSGEQMLQALRGSFEEVAHRDGFSFQHRMGGGLRSPDEGRTEALARFLYVFDHFAVSKKLMQAGVFYWAGRIANASSETRP